MSTSPTDTPSARSEVVAGRYALELTVASGATFAIHDAWDREAQRWVTVKIIRSEIVRTAGFLPAFRTSMQASASVSHPNLVAVFDWGLHTLHGDAGQSAYVVTERLEAGSLRDILDRGRALTASQALQVGLDICHALAEVHRRNLVHGDVTPSKVLFGADGRARLADLGFAGPVQAAQWSAPGGPENHMVLYASPEVASGKTATAAADVYGLSLSLVEALTGSVPFATDSAAATLRGRVDRLLPVSADLGVLAPVLEHAARPNRSERSTAVEFGLELVNTAKRLPRPEPIPIVMQSQASRSADEPADASGVPVTADHASVPSTDHEVAAVGDEVRATAPSTVADVQPQQEPQRLNSVDSMQTPTAAPTPHRQPSRSRPRWVLPAIAAVVVLVAILGARIALITPTYVVPNLVGQDEAEALNTVMPFSWVVSSTSERSDEVPTRGAIIRTSPPAGESLREGEAFALVVSDGPLLRELPEVTGMNGADALGLLDGIGFEPFTEVVFNEVIEVGEVISWQVPDDPTLSTGAEVEPGTLIRLVLSGGPAPRTVPDLLGKVVGVARAELVNLGLRIVETDGVHSDEIPEGEILSQDPVPGSELQRGEAVAVTVSLGPDLITFPSLPRNASFEEAQRILTDAGFVVELALGTTEGKVEEISINGEEPSVGDEFPGGTVISITAV